VFVKQNKKQRTGKKKSILLFFAGWAGCREVNSEVIGVENFQKLTSILKPAF
jgi:hypothetical protein